MTIWVILAGIIAPAFFWIGYFYYKDQAQPEPFLKIGTAYLLGLLTAYACLQFYSLLPLLGIPYDPSVFMHDNRLLYLLYSIGITGLLEESFKLLPFILIIFRFKSFDEKTDGIIYASAIALGFASFENIEYLQYMEGWELLGRAFASPLTHCVFSSIWGYSLAVSRFKHSSLFKAVWQGLLLSAICHGLFNFLTTSAAWRLAASILILLVWIWVIRILEKSQVKKGS